jgi:AbrB family looped-hinge helix DNA binding protein
MEDFKNQLDTSGRILIPSSIRKQLGLKTHDYFVLRIVGDKLELIPEKTAHSYAQQLVKKYAKNRSLSKELLEERSKEK